MNIDIQARGFHLTPPILGMVQKRIVSVLRARHEGIKRIVVRLGDINGPRGGEDKSCRIQISMPGNKDIFVEDVESDLYTAIFRASERANHALTRRISRIRQHGIRGFIRKARARKRLPEHEVAGELP